MRVPPLFAVYCTLVLLGFAVVKYEGWSLFGSATRAAAAGSNYSSGSSGSHK